MPIRHVPVDLSRRDVLRGGIGTGMAMLGLTSSLRAAIPPPTQISSPLPDTRTKGILVWDLEEQDYVTEEYFVSGQAHVYRAVSMADALDVASRDTVKDLGTRTFSREVLSADQQFTTRLVVYRPRNMQRFSGNTIMETLHPSGGGRSLVWDSMHRFFVANGDAHIGVQHPLTFAGLKAADPGRYDALAAKDPTQLWGMLSQVGGILKGAGSASPLHGHKLKHLLMTGYSYTGVATATFANYHHGAARLADGRNIFDAYVPMADSQYVRPLDVPVMRINTQSDFDSFGGLNNRRPDDVRYRHYEIPGAAHVAVGAPLDAATPPVTGRLPTPAGQPQFSPSACQSSFPAGSYPNDFPLYLAQEALFACMYDWLESGSAPPPSAHIDTNADGSPRLDQWGNATGGLRYPPVSIPVARYGVGSTPSCLLFGYTGPFDADTRRALYGTRAKYVAKIRAEVDRLLRVRLLLANGADQLVAAALAIEPF